MEAIMEALKSLLTDFDPATFVPELDSVMGWLELCVRIAVMAGPLALLVLGLWYLLLPPKEANHIAGYRFFWGMGSVRSWKFTQFIAGISWTAAGLLLSIIMLLIVGGYGGMEPVQMCYSAVTCILWEIGVAAVICLAINVTVMVFFDFKGNLRPFAKTLLPQKIKSLSKK